MDLQSVKSHGTIFRVTIAFRQPSADAWRSELQAEQRLAKMDLVEDLAELASESPVAAIRQRSSDRYRSLVGILPEHRQEFREGLERIRAGGGMAPDDLAQLITSNPYMKGSGPTPGSRSSSGGSSDTIAGKVSVG